MRTVIDIIICEIFIYDDRPYIVFLEVSFFFFFLFFQDINKNQ